MLFAMGILLLLGWGGKLKWIGHTCSLVLWYLLPWALMISLCGAGAFLRIVPGMYSSSAGDLNRISWPGGALVGLELHVLY